MVFIYVIQVPSFATNFGNKTMLSKFFSVCYLLRNSSHKFLFFHSKTLTLCRDYTLTQAETVTQRWLATKETLAQVFSISFEFCKIFKNTFFNRTPSVAVSAQDQFLLRFSEKDYAPKYVNISFSRLKFSLNPQLFFI